MTKLEKYLAAEYSSAKKVREDIRKKILAHPLWDNMESYRELLEQESIATVQITFLEEICDRFDLCAVYTEYGD